MLVAGCKCGGTWVRTTAAGLRASQRESRICAIGSRELCARACKVFCLDWPRVDGPREARDGKRFIVLSKGIWF